MIQLDSIKVTKTEHSRLSSLNFENIPFGRVFSDHMFVMDYADGHWGEPAIVPLDALEVHPSNMAWHYGQSIFEGMKAFKDKDGDPVLFRPQEHALRFNRSAERMCMPTVDVDLFVLALRQLVALDREWIPTSAGSSLYIRPFMFATDEYLGVAPSQTYKFIVLTLPVGPYYSKPVRLYADKHFSRAVPGGVGEAKTSGNYAASLYPSRLAANKGYDQVLWLDPVEHEYIQEVGTMNIFFVFEDEIVTPSLDGAVLRGITRDSFLTILGNKSDLTVSERRITLTEVWDRHAKGELKEVFGAGTAAVVTYVSHIGTDQDGIDLDVEEYQIAPFLKEKITNIRLGVEADPNGWIVKV